jgi:hypothetical protein
MSSISAARTGTMPAMGERGPDARKTYRVVGNPDASRRKTSAEAKFFWVLVGGFSCALVIYIARLLADWF